MSTDELSRRALLKTAAVASMAVGCGAALNMAAPAVAHAQQFTMKLSSPTVNDAPHEWMKAFKAGVEQRSGGRIKVLVYPASQLGQIPATVEGSRWELSSSSSR